MGKLMRRDKVIGGITATNYIVQNFGLESYMNANIHNFNEGDCFYAIDTNKIYCYHNGSMVLIGYANNIKSKEKEKKLELKEYKCKNCGASLDVSKNKIIVRCDYCRTTYTKSLVGEW